MSWLLTSKEHHEVIDNMTDGEWSSDAIAKAQLRKVVEEIEANYMVSHLYSNGMSYRVSLNKSGWKQLRREAGLE